MKRELQARVERVARRQRRFELWRALSVCWAVSACVGFGVITLQRQSGWSSSLALPIVALAGLVSAIVLIASQRRAEPDRRKVACAIEACHPELDGRLLTAVQQQPKDGGELNYLQQRLLDEVLRLSRERDWSDAVPAGRLGLALLAHWVALALFVATLAGLRVPQGHGVFTRESLSSITVTPGDATLERGSTLVVLTRFTGPLPAAVELVQGQQPGFVQRTALAKSLADPMFGGAVTEVASNFVYHIEYAGQRTRDFHVTVFEYPRLESADAGLVFPNYTKQPPQHIENTRRVTAVEGSRLDLALRLNKPVVSAQLVERGKNRSVLPLAVDANHPSALLTQFLLETNATYDLQLIDADGRTNKVQSQFVFAALKNRTPELHLALPRGDLRPSPLEEVSFEGTVWDDFGVRAYGLGYAMVGQDTKFIELGRDVPGKEKRPFQYLLRLEQLGLQPDQLVSWFVWADDVGPNGQVRRTTGDLFFAEVRPFEEVFREGQGMDGESQQQAGQSQGQSRSGRLAELQKQIISATWRLLKEQGTSGESPGKPDNSPAGPPNNSGGAPIPQGTSYWPAKPESRKFPSSFPRVAFLAAVGADAAAGQSESAPLHASENRNDRGSAAPAPAAGAGYQADAGVVRDSQAQALEQANAALSRQQDPRASALWSNASKEMEKALERLNQAAQSPGVLPEALAAEQAAYQALLKLQEHEYQVSRSRSRNQQRGGQGQQMQRQLEQMDLAQSENRYETQRLAQSPQNPQRQEQLQVANRLQELARRQQDLNDRLKELQTALQEARTEKERQELQRQLKRLQEQEQQMLADVDELRQRMDRPENQSSMTDERRQLDQTREDVQRAAEAAAKGAASQALASGTRAQRQFQQLHDEMRQRNSSQFSNELRDMRNEARELARQQEELAKKLAAEDADSHKSLSGAPEQQTMLNDLARQKERLTNLVERATQVSQQAEQAEPLLSRQLYDSVRQFTQDTAKGVNETQDELLQRRLMTRGLYDQLKESSEPDGAKLMDLTAELLRLGFLPQANETSQRVGTNINQFRRGVERAAESVLGDEAEAMRLAQQQLEQLTDELQREMSQAGGGQSETNRAQPGSDAQRGGRGESPGLAANDAPRENQASTPGTSQPRDAGGQNQAGADRRAARDGNNLTAGGGGGQRTEYGGNALDRLLGNDVLRPFGPITGGDYGPWSDRLRDVEEMLDQPDLRNRVAVARDRVRLMRQEFQHDRKKPDWAVVRLQVMKPLQEVRDRLADELARRESREALVPVDRDPVPTRYSELVRRYYEELGKDKGK